MNISAHFRLWFVLTTLCTAALVGCGEKPQPTSVAAAPARIQNASHTCSSTTSLINLLA